MTCRENLLATYKRGLRSMLNGTPLKKNDPQLLLHLRMRYFEALTGHDIRTGVDLTEKRKAISERLRCLDEIAKNKFSNYENHIEQR